MKQWSHEKNSQFSFGAGSDACLHSGRDSGREGHGPFGKRKGRRNEKPAGYADKQDV